MLNIDGVAGWIAGLVVELGLPGKRSARLVDRPPKDIGVPTYTSRNGRPFRRHNPLQLSTSVDHLSNVMWGLEAFYRLRAGGGMQWCTPMAQAGQSADNIAFTALALLSGPER